MSQGMGRVELCRGWGSPLVGTDPVPGLGNITDSLGLSIPPRTRPGPWGVPVAAPEQRVEGGGCFWQGCSAVGAR